MVLLKSTPDDIVLASEALRKGSVVALPTETVYGLAACVLREDAVRNVFAIKGRPFIDPLIVHILEPAWIETVCQWNMLAECLAARFWPGPLTFILPKKPQIPDIVTAGGNTVAVRMPSHALFRKVLKAVGAPLAAPSANPFGYLSPTRAEHVVRSLGERVPFILDGGPCSLGLESTIIDLSSPQPKILRPGPIVYEQLCDALRPTAILPYGSSNASAKTASPLKAPGLLTQHYSPHTPLYLWDTQPPTLKDTSLKVAYIFLQRPPASFTPPPQAEIFWLSEKDDLNEAASNLFALLQQLDNKKFQALHVEKPPSQGIGIAINDRLMRAAARFNKQ